MDEKMFPNVETRFSRLETPRNLWRVVDRCYTFQLYGTASRVDILAHFEYKKESIECKKYFILLL